MQVATATAFLGFLMLVPSLSDVIHLFSNEPVAQPLMVAERSIAAALCGGFAVSGVKMFITTYRKQHVEPIL